mgnify:CR=1 FL=1
MTNLELRLTEMLQPAVDALGFELLGVEFLRAGNHSTLRVYIDHENGISVDTIQKVEKEIEIRFLKVKCGVRYWEDGKVNGVEDTGGDLIPLREGDYWCPLIEVDTGIIQDWAKGTIE